MLAFGPQICISSRGRTPTKETKLSILLCLIEDSAVKCSVHVLSVTRDETGNISFAYSNSIRSSLPAYLLDLVGFLIWKMCSSFTSSCGSGKAKQFVMGPKHCQCMALLCMLGF